MQAEKKILNRLPPDNLQTRGYRISNSSPGKCIPVAAIRWPDFRDRSPFGRPSDQIHRHPDASLPPNRARPFSDTMLDQRFVRIVERSVARLPPLLFAAIGYTRGQPCSTVAYRQSAEIHRTGSGTRSTGEISEVNLQEN